MNIPFTRTPTGIVGKWRFHPQPTIWVEGPTDIFFYSPIVDDLKCRLEAFYGSENAQALIEGLRNDDLPYVVILDGDYELLIGRRSPHRRLVRLRRYSFENYLWEREPVNRACHRAAQSGDRTDVVGAEFDRLTANIDATLRPLVELDVAARRCDPAPKVLPDRVEILLTDHRRPNISSEKAAKMVEEATKQIPASELREAKENVAKYLKFRRLADLLKGHILFGVLRLLFTNTATKVKGKKVVMNDDALTQLLSDATWRNLPSDDHRHLRSSVRRALKEIQAFFPVK